MSLSPLAVSPRPEMSKQWWSRWCICVKYQTLYIPQLFVVSAQRGCVEFSCITCNMYHYPTRLLQRCIALYSLHKCLYICNMKWMRHSVAIRHRISICIKLNFMIFVSVEIWNMHIKPPEGMVLSSCIITANVTPEIKIFALWNAVENHYHAR